MAEKVEMVTFEIQEHIGVLDLVGRGEPSWTKELNIVSWNGGPAKYDIRDWSPDHERMSRGITLTEQQARTLAEILADKFGMKEEEWK